MNLFIVSSFYQLYNAISIAYNKKKEHDVIIIKKNIYTNIDRVKLLEVFKSVYYWGDIFENIYDDNIKTNIDKVKATIAKVNLLINKKIINYLPNKNKVYNKIYVAYPDYPSQLIYYHFKKKNSKLCIIEDGTYTYECFATQIPYFRKALSIHFFGSFILDDCKEVIIRNKSFFNWGYRKDLNVKEIIKIENSTYFIYLQNVFKDKSPNILEFKRNIIFFDQNIELLSVKKLQYSFVNKIIIEIGLKELLVKLHPSTKNKKYPNNTELYCGKVPFEILMSLFSFDNKVLVSIFSTACFSPKMILDQEPYVFFLYKIVDKEYHINKQFVTSIDKLRKKYRDKSKIFVPETVDEFINNLKDVLENKER